jgi:hypothetical protein
MPQLLGKLPYEHDIRTLTLGRYMDSTILPSVPVTVSLPNITSWGMMLNDSLGDCAIACPGHLEMVWTDDAGSLFTPSDPEILTAYEAISGYNPSDAQPDGSNPTDTGCVILNVLKYWTSTGIAGHKIGAYVRIDTQDVQALQSAVYLFGGVDFGFQLPEGVQGASTWTIGGSGAKWAPGSWGGHSVPGVAYDASGVTVITWGEPLVATWDFVARYADEAWAMISPDFLAGGVSPQGFNLTALNQDLQVLSGLASPAPERSRRHWWSFV